MGLPILKYVDIALGLAVVILLICTIVTAVAQVLLSFTYSRARYLRDGLEDLISQLDPDTLSKDAYYIAERCLRHPLVGRNNTLFGQWACNVRNWFRKRGKDPRHPLPSLNPPDVLERDELVLMLLEWAANEGPLALQDKQLQATLANANSQAEAMNGVREKIKVALLKNGVADPGQAARDIRAKIVDLENGNPAQASAISRSLAIAAAAPSDFVGKIHVWFDNTMARISNQYGLLAQVWAAILAFLVVFSCQFDALDLIKRLSEDDKLRADLVQQAKDQTARIDDAQKKIDAAGKDAAAAAAQTAQPPKPPQTTPSDSATGQQREIDDATLQRQQISASLAVLRDPSRAILPNYFLWEKVAQSAICVVASPPAGNSSHKGTIKVDADSRDFRFAWGAAPAVDMAVAIRSSGAPVAIYAFAYEGKECLRFVARDRNTGSIAVEVPDAVSNGKSAIAVWPTEAGIDWQGYHNRLAGMVLGTILVSLGAPFWFDLLKKLMGLRSLLATKDDADREQRQGQEGPLPSSSGSGGGGTGPAGGTDERGDLTATGGAG